MFTEYTYQDWLAAEDKTAAALMAMNFYKSSDAFIKAGIADRYYRAENDAVSRKVILQGGVLESDVVDADGNPTGEKRTKVYNKEIPGNRVYSDFFRRFVLQESQYLLGNGVTLDEGVKQRLGLGFDTLLSQMGTWALVHGVCWGFWNADHLEVLRAYRDEYSGFVALRDEMTCAPMVGIQFWRLSWDKPLMMRVFEPDGVTLIGGLHGVQVLEEKRPYKQTFVTDALGDRLIGGENYAALPIIPLYANEMERTELSLAIRSKIDAYDRILSDFADNLDKANDVYWVLNNFGGSVADIANMLESIRRLKAIANVSDGSTASTVEPKSFEVPYAARATALDLLEKALYKDFSAVNMQEITGGSLTNVAIRAATANLERKCDVFEWQVRDFVQQLLALTGIRTERISFKRQDITNSTETVQNIYMAQGDLDRETRLRLNPMVQDEDIPGIMERRDAEETVGLSLSAVEGNEIEPETPSGAPEQTDEE